MHKKSTAEMIEVMKAYEEGRKIECHHEMWDKGVYTPAKYPSWDWNTMDYRVASPKPKKIIKLYPALMKGISAPNDYFISTSLFESIEDAKKDLLNTVRLLTEYPAVEVEVEVSPTE